MCIIKLYTHQCNKIYDMTDPIKTITPVRGGDVTFFAMFIYKCPVGGMGETFKFEMCRGVLPQKHGDGTK